ncbi:bifunctional 2-polyprenyl-6-hydroxyphenol methylase/3-demethylubiquinol 3-O-methyltransferase UbiG [Thalassotalea maritima]|uniref:bifunctional 2-polyprenyl-6-hydroxyphenol methylase/3-demethylubiquinol 3-O-methyltransferase UbiG n=1 Tax=Thalassotalea maritima TaxID=3242416 RepID=UPI003527CF79
MTKPVNVNPDEIAKFERIAHQWWDLEGDFKPLHQINPLRRNFIQSHVGNLFDLNIIDVGCGGGILAESLAKLGAKVTGIDMGEEPLNVARLHALEAGVSVNYQKIPVEDKATAEHEQYDVVTCMEMLEHVPDPQSIVKACSDLVKPGGYVFFSTLNKTMKSYLFAIVGAEKVLKLVPNGTHDWDKFIRPSQLIGWAEQNNLHCFDATGIHYNPLTENHKLADGLDVNYIIACRKVSQD